MQYFHPLVINREWRRIKNIIEAIINEAGTGQTVDGKTIISPMEKAVRIRIWEEKEDEVWFYSKKTGFLWKLSAMSIQLLIKGIKNKDPAERWSLTAKGAIQKVVFSGWSFVILPTLQGHLLQYARHWPEQPCNKLQREFSIHHLRLINLFQWIYWKVFHFPWVKAK